MLMRSFHWLPPDKRNRRNLSRWLPGTLLLMLVLGCGEPAQIQEYTIPKSTEKNQKAQERPMMAAPSRLRADL